MNQSADQPVNVTFSDSIVLKSYRLVHGQQPERLQLRLAFVARRRTEQDYTIFVHVYDQHGNLLQVADGPPLSEFYTTSYWQPGVEVVEWRPIPLPGDMEADVSSLGVGLYDPHTGARLPGVIDGRALENGELRIPFQQ
jgi:hypothetical protein